MQETILRPETNPPELHAAQARRVLANICQIPLQDLVWNNLTPRLPFFLSKAADCMLQGVIYSAGPEVFALGVEHTFEGMPTGERSFKGKRGRRWMPLNLIAFSASFVSTFSFAISVAFFLTSFLASDGTCTHCRIDPSWRSRYKARWLPVFFYFLRGFDL